MRQPNPDNPLELILYAAQEQEGGVLFLNFANLVQKARIKKKQLPGGAMAEVGQLLVQCPAELARTLKSGKDKMDVLVLAVVKRETYNTLKSGIIIPKIVMPS